MAGITLVSRNVTVLEPNDACGLCDMILAGMVSGASESPWDAETLLRQVRKIGIAARTQCPQSDDEIVDLLCEKQRAYGCGNILAFGMTGIHVRMSDKISRLKNLMDNSYDPDWEPISDSWLDLVGYAVVGSMLHHGTFELGLID